MNAVVLKLVASLIFGLVVMLITRFAFKRVDLSAKAFWLGCFYAFCGLGLVFWAIVICIIPMLIEVARNTDKKQFWLDIFAKLYL